MANGLSQNGPWPLNVLCECNAWCPFWPRGQGKLGPDSIPPSKAPRPRCVQHSLCGEGERWTINIDINVWQIKWLVNNLLTALTSKPLSSIDLPAASDFNRAARGPGRLSAGMGGVQITHWGSIFKVKQLWYVWQESMLSWKKIIFTFGVVSLWFWQWLKR